jgi:hypothetical protein
VIAALSESGLLRAMLGEVVARLQDLQREAGLAVEVDRLVAQRLVRNSSKEATVCSCCW